MYKSNDFSTFSKEDLQKLIKDTLYLEADLIMKIIAEGIALTESEEINSAMHLIINDLNRHLIQHVFRMLDY